MPVIDLTLDSTGAVRGLKQYDAASKQAGGSTDSLTGKVKTSGAAFLQMTAAVAAAGAAIGTAYVIKVVKAASTMEETQNKFDVVFRGMTDSAEEWASNLASSYGMSEQESKKYLSSVQDLLVPMGMARDSAGEMSNEIVKLSADLGSFNDMPTETVMRSIQSALVGNYESMKQYGVVINATMVQQEALNLGLANSKEELTAADKAQAAYSLMVKASGDAIGDFERSQYSLANQLKILVAGIEDFNAKIGKVFLPYATKAITAMNKWAKEGDGVNKMFNKFLKVTDAAVVSIQFIHNGISGLILIGDSLVVAFSYMFDFIVAGFNKMIQPASKFFDALVKIGAVEANPFDKLSTSLSNFSEDLQYSSKVVLTEHVKKIDENNAAYDRFREKIQAVNTAAKQTEEALNKNNKVVKENTTETKSAADANAKYATTTGEDVPEAAKKAESAIRSTTAAISDSYSVANDATVALSDLYSAMSDVNSVEASGSTSGFKTMTTNAGGVSSAPSWMSENTANKRLAAEMDASADAWQRYQGQTSVSMGLNWDAKSPSQIQDGLWDGSEAYWFQQEQAYRQKYGGEGAFNVQTGKWETSADPFSQEQYDEILSGLQMRDNYNAWGGDGYTGIPDSVTNVYINQAYSKSDVEGLIYDYDILEGRR